MKSTTSQSIFLGTKEVEMLAVYLFVFPSQATTHAPETESEERLTDSDKVLIAFQPHILPAGIQARLYLPLGDYLSGMVGAGAAMAVLETGNGTPARARVEGGLDYYFGERFDSLFFGARVQASYWTAPPAYFGGTNVSSGVVLGQRFPLGREGATFGVTGGAIVKAFYQYRAATDTDGVQVMPMGEIDFSMPNRRRRQR